MTLLKQTFTLWILLLCLVFTPCASASETWNILVVPEYDSDSLEATHRAYKTAGAKIRDKLSNEFKLDVYSGQASNINLQCKKQCDENSRAKFIKDLREANEQSERAPIDLVVFYHIMENIFPTSVGMKRLIRVSSLAMDIETGKTVAYDDGDQQQAELIKPAEDLSAWTVAIANRNARDSAAYIGERLAAYERKIEFQLKMINFAASDLLAFENHLRMHQANQTGQLTLKGTIEDKKQLLHHLVTHTYFLETPMGSDTLKNAIEHYFEDEGLSINVSYHGITDAGREFDVKHIGLAHRHRYILAAIVLLLAVILLLVSLSYRKRNKVTAERSLKQGTLSSLFTSADKAVEAKDAYVALSYIDKALLLIEGFDELKEEALSLRAKRATALSLIDTDSAQLDLEGALSGLSFLSKDEVLIGRPSSSASADIQINYKRLSRPGKQTMLQRQGNHFVVIDQGSTHGTSIDGVFIKPGEAHILKGRSVLALGGDKEKSTQGACRFLLEPIDNSSSILIQFDQNSLALLDRKQLAQAWPSMETDLRKKWLCITDDVAVGELKGQLNIQSASNEKALFYFTKENGKAIGIRPNLSEKDNVLSINGIEINGRVPLQKGLEIGINQYRFNVV